MGIGSFQRGSDTKAMTKPIANQKLHQVGLKVTTPRLKILYTLENTDDRHMSAENIYQRLHEQDQEISIATIYRVLTQFEAANLVTKHHFEGGSSVFELNQGPHHDHLVCVKCGHVDEFVDEQIEQRQATIAKHANFKMTAHCLNIYGLCGQCQS